MTELSRAVAVGLLVTCAVTGLRAGQQPVNADAQILQDFKQRVDKYMELHTRLDKQAPALQKKDEPERIKASQDALAAALRKARATATQGEIFTPAIAAHLRRLMSPEVKGPGSAETKKALKDDAPAAITLKVNAAYPDSLPLPTVPPNLLASLPELPKELEYRIIGHDLILLDAHANLIVDFIPKAIP